MKINNRRLIKGISASLSLAISLLSVPMVSLAAPYEPDEDYAIVVAGKQVMKSNCEDVLGDGTVSYDPETKTLDFKDAEISTGYTGSIYGVQVTCGVIIFNNQEVTITGDATISDIDVGICVDYADRVKIGDGAKLDITCDYLGIFANNIDITGSEIKVEANKDDSFSAAVGINSVNELNITDSVIDATAYGNGTALSGNATIDKGSVITAKGDSYGLWGYGGTLNIADAKVTVDAPVCLYYTYINVTDDNAVLDLTSKKVGGKKAVAIRTNGSLDISAGTLLLTGSQGGVEVSECHIYGENTYIYINTGAHGCIITGEGLFMSDVSIIHPKSYYFNKFYLCDMNGDVANEILISHNHEMKKVDAAEPTKEKDGNIEYYECEKCGRFFKDENGFELITDKSSVIIPKLDPEPTPIATPTAVPTGEADPTSAPSATPTSAPTATPTSVSTSTPTSAPVATATATPTTEPTVSATPTAEPTVTPTTEPANTEDSKTQIRAFVDRIYKFVLDREPEEEGADFWTGELYNFTRSGAEVAQGFIFSAEFENRKTTDEQFVTILYKTFFDRDPEEDGMKFWLEQLSTGTMDRATVANGFIFSQEWADTCAAYGIRSGGDLKAKTNIEPTELTYNFVKRMYTTALAREAEEEGLKYWAAELANFNVTGEQVGSFFFLSDEMASFNLNDTEFLNRLYKTFMDRDADEDGAKYWLGVLASGTPRADVVMGFTRSPEFTAKCIDARILPFV